MFGQVVIGPPGAGKTTYCKAMHQFLTSLGRKVTIINLDPANDILPYECSIDIAELITLEDVMEAHGLGPNGGLMYCMEFLEKNIKWLHQHIAKIPANNYVLFDCPGQVELYTHHMSVRNIFAELTSTTQTAMSSNTGGHRLTAVHLVDSHYCSDPPKFISVLLTSLSTMLRVELPHINILSKVDLIEKYGKLPYNLDFFTDVLDLSYLMEQFETDKFFAKHLKLNKAIIELVEDYSLVTFIALSVQSKECMLRVAKAVDKANGYIFNDLEERNIHTLLSCAVGAEFEYEKVLNIREKYMDREEKEDDKDQMKVD